MNRDTRSTSNVKYGISIQMLYTWHRHDSQNKSKYYISLHYPRGKARRIFSSPWYDASARDGTQKEAMPGFSSHATKHRGVPPGAPLNFKPAKDGKSESQATRTSLFIRDGNAKSEERRPGRQTIVDGGWEVSKREVFLYTKLKSLTQIYRGWLQTQTTFYWAPLPTVQMNECRRARDQGVKPISLHQLCIHHPFVRSSCVVVVQASTSWI